MENITVEFCGLIIDLSTGKILKRGINKLPETLFSKRTLFVRRVFALSESKNERKLLPERAISIVAGRNNMQKLPYLLFPGFV
jgi:hypothetical protein